MPGSASHLPDDQSASSGRSSPDDDAIQRLRQAVEGLYEVEREIGSGGMAIVYRGKDLRQQGDVAIKVLRDELRTNVAEKRFLREIQVATRLQHPNIVPLLASGAGDRVLYYAMPFVEGESLGDRLRREQNLPIPEALEITRQVAAALQHAHTLGIVHRDVKPQNILLSGDRVMLADFGVARALTEAGGDTLTQSGVTVGTTGYISPEQAGRSHHIDGRADIYSLGCVLYEMLAGQPPFTGPSAQVVIARHLADPPPSLKTARPTVSAELQRVVETALAKDAADRFTTAAAFGEAIERVAAGRRYRRWPLLPPRRWRAPIGAAIAAVAGVWLVTRGDPPTFDPNRIVVFPLVERGLAPADTGAGADVAFMIGAALEHTAPLRWLDGWRELDERQRADAGGVTARAARRITRGRGARFFIDGAVGQVQDSIAVTLRLHDALADSIVAQETAAVAARVCPCQAGLAALARVLPALLDPGRVLDVELWAQRNPAAVALWLQGERQYRQSQYAQALTFYQRALQQDSGLVFAASKGADAAIFLHRPEDARQFVQAARAREALLPERYAAFARGIEAFLNSQADTAVKWLRRALAITPDWPEAWMALGEVYRHLLPAEAPLDSLTEAAFASAWRSDTSFTPPLLHLFEIALRRGDVALARRFTRALPDSSLDDVLAAMRRVVRACVEHGRSGVDWRAEASQHLHALLLASKELAVAGAHLDCAETGFRAVLDEPHAAAAYRWAALVATHGLLIAQNRTSEAAALLEAEAKANRAQALYLSVFDLLLGAPMQTQAAAMESAARERYGPAYRGASPHVLWLLGVWHERTGDLGSARRVQAALEVTARQPAARRARLLADGFAARMAAAHGDTATAITRLRALAPTATRDSLIWDLWEPLAAERYLLAELLLARGSFQEAHDVASAFDHAQPAAYLMFLAASLSIRLRAAGAQGKADLVRRYRARLLHLNRADLAGAVP